MPARKRKSSAKRLTGSRGPESPSRRGAGLSVFGPLEIHQFEKNPSPMCIFDDETLRPLAVNDAALRLYGYTRDEFMGLTLGDTRPCSGESELGARLTTSIMPRHGGMRTHLKKSGEVFVADVVSQDVIFDGRKATLVLVLETSERARLQTQRMEREKLFTALVEHSPDIIARIDRDLRHVYVNPAVATATGVAPEQLIGSTNRQLGVPLELCVRWAAGVRRVFATGRQQEIEITFPGSDGTRCYESHMVPELDAEGRVESVLAIARDITGRKRAELALRASETKLRHAQHEFETLADALPQVIACYDRELKHTYANAAIASLTAVPRAEIVGRTTVEAGFAPRLAEMWDRNLRSVFETGRPSHLEFEHAARQYEARHIPMTGDDDTTETVLCVTYDLTDRKRAEEERLSAMARQSDALLREVHHRVKNNLQGVVGLLRQLANMHEPLAPVLAKAVSQLQAMAVVHGLHGRDWREGVALVGMVTEIAKSVERTTGVQIKCNADLQEDHRSVHLRESEAVAVALVVNELILNAAKHGSIAPGKGAVTVNVKSDAQRAEVAVLNKGALPAHFDFKQGDGLGTGLELVKALVPADGASLAFSRNNGHVRATLELDPPVMARAPDSAKEMRDEWDRRRRAYSDRRR